jgi:predicted secreted protein
MTVLIVHWAVLLSAFLIFWFLTFFCLLSVGLGGVDPETGAPLGPKLGLKATIATAIAAVLWIAFYAMILMGVFDL